MGCLFLSFLPSLLPYLLNLGSHFTLKSNFLFIYFICLFVRDSLSLSPSPSSRREWGVFLGFFLPYPFFRRAEGGGKGRGGEKKKGDIT
ncbi:hypothetical protein F4809DRAFT_604774 [Biscogniauxia mediterranea]|nr:hypothetical protein F4809DRAFT_604774 [Biscogniauxia mediterranea]